MNNELIDVMEETRKSTITCNTDIGSNIKLFVRNQGDGANIALLESMLRDGRVTDVNVRDESYYDYTALMFQSTKKGSIEAMKWLLTYRSEASASASTQQHQQQKIVDIDLRARGGDSALMCAVFANDPDKVRLLLEYGADRDIPDNDGLTPLKWAKRTKKLNIVAILESYFPLRDKAKAKEKAEAERLVQEQSERERLAKVVADQIEENERLSRVSAEKARLAKIETARITRIKVEADRKERQEREWIEMEIQQRNFVERERLARENAERERPEREKAEMERHEREQAIKERAAKERAEKERIAREWIERERRESEQLERERREREWEEMERLEKFEADCNATLQRRALERFEKERRLGMEANDAEKEEVYLAQYWSGIFGPSWRDKVTSLGGGGGGSGGDRMKQSDTVKISQKFDGINQFSLLL